VKVFDNLYFLGPDRVLGVGASPRRRASSCSTPSSTTRSRTKSSGGLKKLGLDPAQIKYVMVSHGHLDHAGGAKFLQESSARGC
jgi:metallo-beta-lactamase class B